MTHIQARVAALRELVESLKLAESVFERSSLFAAISTLVEKLEKDEQLNGYAREKAFKLGFHAAAALGFDVDNSHSAESHRVWALGELNTLESVID